MKVLALNSSTRPDEQSKTAMMLARLVDGMREAGAEVEKINLRDKKIRYCICCYHCMTTTPGQCIHKDDMSKELFPRWLESDLCVYGTPLFYHTVNAPMKAFLERTFPVCEPFLYEKDGRWHHPVRQQPPAAVFLSVCGFPSLSAFDALSHYANFLYGGEEDRRVLWAEIYRNGAEGMVSNPRKMSIIMDATHQAGRELVETKGVSPETMAVITQTIGTDVGMITDVANSAWQTCIDEGITLPEFQKRQMIPRPVTIRAFMGLMRMGFNSEAARNRDAVIQFIFSGGDVEGECFMALAKGTLTTRDGRAPEADLTIKTPFHTWMDILTGKADGQALFAEGKYQADGDVNLLMDMKKLFGG